jgi:murein L,D-transpeptidase YcbB/YkuD
MILSSVSTNQETENTTRSKTANGFIESFRITKDKAIRRYVKRISTILCRQRISLAWIENAKLRPQADSLLKAIEQSHEEGLEPANYKLKELKQLIDQIVSEKASSSTTDSTLLKKQVQLDFMMTTSYMTYGAHLLSGRIDPYQMDTLWIVHPRRKDLATHLESALASKTIRKSLNELSPAIEQYNQLKSQLANYRNIAKQGGWPLLSGESVSGKNLSPETASILMKRLALIGLADSTQPVTSGSNVQLEQSIRAFQQAHGIKPDGKLTAETIKWLNKPVQEVVQMIELNMERIRWLPDSIGNTYLLVNTPDYVLKAIKSDKQEMQMNVIVGQEYASTPVFTDTLEYLVFSPDWTVPPSIAKNEILPILQKNPDYLLNQDMSVYETWNEKDTTALDPHATDWSQFTPETFNYRIVQNPGPPKSIGKSQIYDAQ